MNNQSEWESWRIKTRKSQNNASIWEAVALITMVALCILFSLLP